MPDFTKDFIRAPINGEVVEPDSPPPLDLRRKHTIEAAPARPPGPPGRSGAATNNSGR